MARKILAFGVISVCLLASACNTVRGAAKDINSAANAVDKAT